MAISGAKQDGLSVQQINNFIKFCLFEVDFSRPGILREEGLRAIKDHLKNQVLPELNKVNFTVEGFSKIPEEGNTTDLYHALEKLAQLGIEGSEKHEKTDAYHITLISMLKEITKKNSHFSECDAGKSLQAQALRKISYFKDKFKYKKPEAGKYLEQNITSRKKFNNKALSFFVNSINFLLEKKQYGLAEMLHNTLQIGNLITKKNVEMDNSQPKMNLDEISKKTARMLVYSGFLVPFGLIGKIVPENLTHEIFLAEEMISVCLRSKIFEVSFSPRLESYHFIEPVRHYNFLKQVEKNKDNEVAFINYMFDLDSDQRNARRVSQPNNLSLPFFSGGRFSSTNSYPSYRALQSPLREDNSGMNISFFCDSPKIIEIASEPRQLIFSRSIMPYPLEEDSKKKKEKQKENKQEELIEIKRCLSAPSMPLLKKSSNLLFPRPLDSGLQSDRPENKQVRFSIKESCAEEENSRRLIVNRDTTGLNSFSSAQAFDDDIGGLTKELSELNLRLSRIPEPVTPRIMRPRAQSPSSRKALSAASTVLKPKENKRKP